MKDATFNGFTSEMEKIADTTGVWAKSKNAGLLRDLGAPIVQTGKRVAQWAGRHAGEVNTNVATTLHHTFTNPLQAMKEGVKFSLPGTGGSGVGKALAVGGLALQGVTTAGEVAGLRNAADPTGHGRGRGERLGGIIGSTAGGFIGAPHGITGGIVGSEVARRGLGAVGKGVDKAVAMIRRKPQAAPMRQGPVNG